MDCFKNTIGILLVIIISVILVVKIATYKSRVLFEENLSWININ